MGPKYLAKAIDYRISLNETNVLKGIAICAMLFHHLFMEHREYGVFLFKIALACKVCVAIFVFLSGYGLATQFEKWISQKKSSLGVISLKFVVRRFVKFYLSYWIVFVIAVPLGIFVFGRNLSIPYGADSNIPVNLFIDFLGLQGMHSYNVTWWFNRLILFLYILFPLLFVAMRNYLLGVSVLVLLFVWPREVLFPLEILCSPLSTYMFVFGLGVFFARKQEGINVLLGRMNPKIILAFSLVGFCVLCYMRQNVVIRSFCGVAVDPFITIFLVLFVVSLCRIFGLKMKFLAFVGKHSMNMYLLHTFVAGYFIADFIYGFKYPVIIFAMQFGISLMLSIILEFAKEKAQFYKFQKWIVEKLNP